LGFSGEDYGYAIDLGLPMHPTTSLFALDPVIKIESLWVGEQLKRARLIAERRGPLVRIRKETGEWRDGATELSSVDSMMTHCADPADGAELLILRERMREWRFYDLLRTDREAPARRPQIGTYTPVLASDGADLPAAIQTIVEIGDRDGLADSVNDAFPGGRLEVENVGGSFGLLMRQPGLLRPLKTAELSDGTLRYLLLIAALLSPRPPPLMVLNEPEASLHPSLLTPLARLIGHASQHTQIIIVSHARDLIEPLGHLAGCRQILLEKPLGETLVHNGETISWSWPER